VARPITAETRQKNRIRDLERIVAAWPSVLLEADVWQYIEALSALHHVAHHGIRRPDDLGGTITGHAPHSTGTRDRNWSMAQYNAERAHLRQRTRLLHGELDQFDGGAKTKDVA
jgi:hypothetical protein